MMIAVLLVRMLALGSVSTAVTVGQFYPFGSDSDDTLLFNGQQEPASFISASQQLPFDLPILSATATSYQVSTQCLIGSCMHGSLSARIQANYVHVRMTTIQNGGYLWLKIILPPSFIGTV